MPRSQVQKTVRKKAARPEPAAAAREESLRDEAWRVLDGLKGPLVPEGEACFPVEPGIDPGRLHRALAQELDELRAVAEGDPFTNPIQMLALHISNRLHSGELSFSGLEALIQRLTFCGFVARAERLRGYLGEFGRTENAATLRELVRGLADRRNIVWGGAKAEAAEPGLIPFQSFKSRVELDLFGVVFTAHPTFGLPATLMRRLAELAAGRGADGAPLDPPGRAAILREAATAAHRPDADLDLDMEHALSLEAITNMQAAMREAYDVIFEVTEELYPGRAVELTPRLVTVASWVGYDLDGRSDILWSDTLEKRLRVQEIQLRHYRDAVRAIRGRCAETREAAEVDRTLERLQSRLDLAITELDEEIEVFSSPEVREASGRERIRRIAKRMHEGRAKRLVDSGSLIRLITDAMGSAGDGGVVRRLWILRAELANYGLGMARTHVRLNASQLHNAIRKAIAMETGPDDPAHRRTYMNALNGLLGSVEPVTINFGSILAERASAKRLFMIIAQMLKYVDATTPVRFLIAESETAFTPLTALYFAKLFGVEDKVDISPLFETRKALETGARVVEEMLENEHYRAYVRRRGRLCIQTGFSDAGRYLGQTAAAVAIESLRLKVGELMARHGLEGVQLVVFDTHGESIGRGGHPASLRDRLNYVSSPACRSLFIRNRIPFKEEISFQGGDGYLYFMNPATASATVCRILENVLETPQARDGDPFYEDPDTVGEFFSTVKQFNAEVMEDANYAALLGAFGVNFLYPAGSRSMKRQHEVAGAGEHPSHPSQIRAIPHNSILQQLGMLAITLGGVGQAIRKDEGRFRSLYAGSDRFRRLMGMVEFAFSFSSVDVFKAYVDIFDPGLWLLRAARTRERDLSEEMHRVSEHLEHVALHERLAKIFRTIQKDYLEVRAWRLTEDTAGDVPGGRGRVLDKETRDDLVLLHAVRMALINEVYLLATRVPEFSLQTGVTREQVIESLMGLDVLPAVEALERIFPRFGDMDVGEDFGEPATYKSEESLSYAQEHERIFQPLTGVYELIRRASSGISHIIGAVG
ncbi:MAG: phosphoenolpyruvate carboxylase [Alphaproteobacteria bacterium]